MQRVRLRAVIRTTVLEMNHRFDCVRRDQGVQVIEQLLVFESYVFEFKKFQMLADKFKIHQSEAL